MYKEIAGLVLNQRSVLLIKVCTKLKGKCFLIRYFSYTQTVMGKFKNQDGLRKPKGLPPNVTEKKNKKVETRPHSKKRKNN